MKIRPSIAVMRSITILGSLIPALCSAQVLLTPPTPPNDKADTQQQVIADRRNSPEQEKKPYIILISADGFRYDLADKYQAPNLLQFREEGVAAASMKPSFPTLTFPNHYSLATGLYPSHHGIVDNAFYDSKRKQAYFIKDREAVRDGSWYGGTPIWVLAEQQKMLTASFYWVGTEAPIRGIYPTYFYYFARGLMSLDQRKPLKGMHGWDNELPDLQASFYSWGPAFKQHVKIGPFENVAVYPMIAQILGLKITEKIDGDAGTLKNILR